uniref:Uncharacterized protein n=1 Tax=Panagrellus redivivus TaxID=6233 RepID=A0A7E4UTA3_PANRE
MFPSEVKSRRTPYLSECRSIKEFASFDFLTMDACIFLTKPVSLMLSGMDVALARVRFTGFGVVDDDDSMKRESLRDFGLPC